MVGQEKKGPRKIKSINCVHVCVGEPRHSEPHTHRVAQRKVVQGVDVVVINVSVGAGVEVLVEVHLPDVVPYVLPRLNGHRARHTKPDLC